MVAQHKSVKCLLAKCNSSSEHSDAYDPILSPAHETPSHEPISFLNGLYCNLNILDEFVEMNNALEARYK